MVEESAKINNITPVEYDPFEGPEIEQVIACTEPQIEILIACQLGGIDANLAFNQSITLNFTGTLDLNAMEFAFQSLLLRHESLRSAFNVNSHQVCIFKNSTFKLLYKDISSSEYENKQQFVSEHIQKDIGFLFDLVNGPLIKAGLIKLDDSHHYLIITAHHIICDGWSVALILRELGKLYSSHVQNTSVDLPEAVSFSRFVKDQIRLTKSREYLDVEKFWLDEYSDNVPLLDLPIDYTRPRTRTYTSNRLDHKLNNNLVAAIKKTGTQAGCSLVITLLAAFETFLCRLTGQDDIVVGLPAAGQSVTGNYHLVGHCVNLLPLRSNLPAEISFLEYLRKRKAGIFDAYDHQQLTFGSLLKKLKISRDSSRVPLIPVAFNVDLERENGVYFHGLKYHLENNPRTNGIFELSLNITGFDNTITLELSYNTQLFKVETIAGLMTDFEDMLKKIITDPFTPLRNLKLKDKNEANNKVRTGKNGALANTLQQSSLNLSIVHLFEEQAEKLPENIALIFSQQQLTYKELNDRSNQLANYLQAIGIKNETLVPICVNKGIEMLVGILGILKAGGAYVPIDPSYPQERIGFMLRDITADIVLCSKESRGKLPGNNSIKIVDLDNIDHLISKQQVNKPKVKIHSGDVAYVMYTSGSTGKPKGVMVTHRNVVSLVKEVDYLSLTETDILLSTGSPAFDATTFEYWGMLLNGGRLVLCTEKKLLDNKSLKKEINKRGVNRMWFTSGWFNQLVEADITLFENLKTILVGGEKLSEHHIKKVRKAYPGLEIINGYGPTENTTFSLTYHITQTNINNPIPIGRPLTNRGAFILDDNLHQTPAGGIGEICLCGAGLSKGYLNRPELTDEKFVKISFHSDHGSTVYRSGDLGRCLPDGNIEFLGRIDEQVKIRGYRIELGEIENVLHQSKLVKHAAVLAKEDVSGTKRLVSYIVPARTFNKEMIISYLRSKLPEYMIPSVWIELRQLPLTSNGKIDKNNLPGAFQDADKEVQVQAKTYSVNEKLIADIWTELLDVGSIKLTDNFFESGGHSLIAIKVMAQIEKQTGKKLPPSSLFQHSTIAKLALALDDQSDTDIWRSLVPIKPSGNKDPIYIIHGFDLDVIAFNYIAMYVDKEQPVYGIKWKGNDGEGKSLDSIEDIASFYISEIIRHNPAGPYALLGYSAGAVIAFEMARQLKAMKRDIKIIGIIDYNVEVDTNYFSSKARKYSIQLVPRLLHGMVLLVRHPKNWIKLQLMRLTSTALKMSARLRLKKKTDLEKAIGKFGFAIRNYSVTPLEIGIDLFSSRVKVNYMRDNEFMGWKPFALNGIKIHKIEGDHYDLIQPPNCEEFAHVLQNILN